MLLLAKAKFVNEKIVRMTINFVYMLRNSGHKYNKIVAISKNECFNYYKIGRFDNYCIMEKSNNSGSSNK